MRIKTSKSQINQLKFSNSTSLRIPKIKFVSRTLISLALRKWMKWMKHSESIPHSLKTWSQGLNKIRTCTSKWLSKMNQFDCLSHLRILSMFWSSLRKNGRTPNYKWKRIPPYLCNKTLFIAMCRWLLKRFKRPCNRWKNLSKPNSLMIGKMREKETNLLLVKRR